MHSEISFRSQSRTGRQVPGNRRSSRSVNGRGASRLGRKLAHASVPATDDARGGLAGDPIDRDYLARFTLCNAALEREVLELFAAQAPVYLERLRAAHDCVAWRNAAHTIKGSASAVGAWRLAHFAQMAEQIELGGDVHGAAANTPRLQHFRFSPASGRCTS